MKIGRLVRLFYTYSKKVQTEVIYVNAPHLLCLILSQCSGRQKRSITPTQSAATVSAGARLRQAGRGQCTEIFRD